MFIRSILVFLLSIFVCFCAFSKTIRKNSNNYFLGLTYLRENQIYSGNSHKNLILPFFKMRHSFFRIDNLRLRAHFLDEKSYATGFQLKYHLNGSESKLTDSLGVNTNRYNSVMGGVYYMQRLLRDYVLSFDLDRGLQGAEGANRFVTTIQKKINPHVEITLIPFFKIEFVDATYVDYYYGLHFEEVNDLEYEGVSTLNYKAGLNMIYTLKKRNWYFYLRGIYTKYGAGITMSPIVSHSQIIKWSTSIVFEL